MRNFGTKNTTKDWINTALKVGILLTEPKLRDAVASRMRDRVDSVTDRVKDGVDQVSDRIADRYEDAIDRLQAVGSALQGRRRTSPLVGFLLGAGIGAGLGVLLAPTAGRKTREAIRIRASDVKDKIVDSASAVTNKFRQPPTRMSTGTEG